MIRAEACRVSADLRRYTLAQRDYSPTEEAEHDALALAVVNKIAEDCLANLHGTDYLTWGDYQVDLTEKVQLLTARKVTDREYSDLDYREDMVAAHREQAINFAKSLFEGFLSDDFTELQALNDSDDYRLRTVRHLLKG